MRMLLFLLALAGATAAHAQLYRWVDPASGSVKYSSYPPPWFGDPARERRAPKVEVIPAGKPPPAQRGDLDKPPAAVADVPGAKPAAPPPAGASTAELAARRRAMLAEIMAQIGSSGGTISPELQKRVEEFSVLIEQLNRADPAGAAARMAEMQAAMQDAMEAATQSPRGAQPR